MLRQMAQKVQVADLELARPDIEKLAVELGGLGLKVIVSHHDFEGQPSYPELQSLVSRAMKYGDVAKISVTPSTPEQVMELYRLLVNTKGRLCVIGMGETGQQTRLLAPLFGSVLTYGYSDEPVAPGQMSVSEVVNGLLLLDICERTS
jgi:3-dehydroquinate dehydratase-1